MRSVATALVILGIASLTLAQPVTERGYVEAKETTCWTCHATWSPPLKEFAAIIPPNNLGGAPGNEVSYTVQFRPLWAPKGGDPVLQRPSVELDLTAAPSLIFGGASAPVAYSESLSLRPPIGSPVALTQPVLANTTLEVKQGASRIQVEAVPAESPAAADIALVIDLPGGQRIIEDSAPAGDPELLVFDAVALASMPPGNWSVGAQYIPVRADPPSFAPSADVQINMDIRFDVEEERILGQAFDTEVRAGTSFLHTWILKPIAAPQAGETVTFSVRGTYYYDHLQDVQGGDYADAVTRLVVPVTQESGEVILQFQASQALRPQLANGPTWAAFAEAVGYASAFLLIASIWSGGMFGMASRRQLNGLFKSAKRRVSFHNFLSYGLMLLAVLHTVIFIVEPEYPDWRLGIIWGGIAILAMAGLGVTGAFQVQLIRSWGYTPWKWTHYGLAIAAILFSVIHGLLDGPHFGDFQRLVGWRDPFLQVPGT